MRSECVYLTADGGDLDRAPEPAIIWQRTGDYCGSTNGADAELRPTRCPLMLQCGSELEVRVPA